MSQLIDGKDELGILFFKKTRKLRDAIEELGRELEFDKLMDEVGIQYTYYDGRKREFFEVGFHCACTAVGRETNAVLTWSEPDNEIITIYADDEAAAEQKILELAKKLRRLLKDKP